MTQHAYSWNGTRIHLVIEDDVADAYNRAFDKYLQTKKEFSTVTPGQDLLTYNFTEAEREAWFGVKQVINAIVSLNGGSIDIQGSEMNSNYLRRVYEDEQQEFEVVRGTGRAVDQARLLNGPGHDGQ